MKYLIDNEQLDRCSVTSQLSVNISITIVLSQMNYDLFFLLNLKRFGLGKRGSMLEIEQL